MRVRSVNVGLPREVEWQGRLVSTAIFKKPVVGKVALRKLNFDGDAQADLTVHGGLDKAIYAYPFEHYAHWETKVGRPLAAGAFGENLTTDGLLEDQVNIGDEFRVGSARLVVTQPRMPCYKLGLRFGDPRMVKRFLKARAPGIYFAVIEEGAVAAGDPIERVHGDERGISLIEMLDLMYSRRLDEPRLRRLLEVPRLAAVWREEFLARLGDQP